MSFQKSEGEWKTVTHSKPKTKRKPIPKAKGAKKGIPKEILAQKRRIEKYNYKYTSTPNGNVENNSTLYVSAPVAHSHQIKKSFDDAIKRAKEMPEIFGKNLECEVQVNVVRRYNGAYMGYAFVDVTNPKIYYALMGMHPDGTERVEYIDSQIEEVPEDESDEEDEITFNWGGNNDTAWGDETEIKSVQVPKIKKELPPLISLQPYEYEPEQKDHLDTEETHGTISISPGFITPGVDEQYDDCKLYIPEVPSNDKNFLYKIFAKYARYDSLDRCNYPKIFIGKKRPDNKFFATVKYGYPHDAAFAKTMLQSIRANYCGKDFEMNVRYALRK